MKILISGSSGFVGSRVLHQWQGRAELFTFPRGSLAAADESAIRRFVETVQPDVILQIVKVVNHRQLSARVIRKMNCLQIGKEPEFQAFNRE